MTKSLFILLITLYGVCFCKAADYTGSICALADLNFDRYTDILVKKSSRELGVLLANNQNWNEDESTPFKENNDFKFEFNWVKDSKDVIFGCFISDFDGDSFPDLLLTLVDDVKKATQYHFKICYGQYNPKLNKPSLTGFNCSVGDASFSDQPSVCDYNVDGYMDIFMPLPNGSLVCYEGGSRTLERLLCPFGENKPYANFMHVYSDITGDLDADLLIGVEGESKELLDFELYQLVGKGKWRKAAMKSPPKKTSTGLIEKMKKLFTSAVHFYAQPTIADLNGDGLMDILLPSCGDKDGNCEDEIELHLWSRTEGDTVAEAEWNTLKISLTEEKDKKWTVISDTNDRFQLRAGDWDLDGYPDLLFLLENKKEGRHVFIAHNIPCEESSSTCGGWQRQFVVNFKLRLVDKFQNLENHKLTFATYFDLYEDGNLDLMLEYADENDESKRTIRFLPVEDKGDKTFLKVQVTTATCSSATGTKECGNGLEASDIAGPGSTTKYRIDGDFGTVYGSNSQLSQSTHRAMQLPFSLFGLGRSPNFVENLEVGIPSFKPMNHSWQQIVPNARLYIIPNLNRTSNWISRMYLTPSRLILLSAASLCCICAVILLIIAALQWRERKLDLAEKQQLSQRFHFDAM